MKQFVLLPAFLLAAGLLTCNRSEAQTKPAAAELARWQREAIEVTIIRDDWGIAHIHGKTDADAVFGMEYAQAEDDFHRVEMNYIDALGVLAEGEGSSAIFQDLRMRLFIDPTELKTKYAASPDWLKQLMNAFADGLNFYLYKHPEVKPLVITHFEPWMALAFSEGSIGGDIYRVNVPRLEAFYGHQSAGGPQAQAKACATEPAACGGAHASVGATADSADDPPEPSGSNGIAISASNSADHHALLYINPHVSFYFRSELQMSSDEGLDAYGAVTWGQFFVYQGFNHTAGWMHTSSGVVNVEQFLETVTRKNGRYYYRYGTRELPMKQRSITIAYKTPSGMAHQTFAAYYTQHGPVIGQVGDKWVSINLMQRPERALIQDFSRMKAKDYAAFLQTMRLHTNSSNNTIFADSEGHIAYWHSDWIPRRSDEFDWTKPVDGSNPATAYHGLLTLAQTPHLFDPADGWLYNSNNWPWSAAGPDSPKRQDFPKYVDRGDEESPRGYHAVRLLGGHRDWIPKSLTAAGFDSYLPAFSTMIPVLVKAYDATPASDPLKSKLADQIEVLRKWDYRWGADSVATSLACFWGVDVFRAVMAAAREAGMSPEDYVERRATPAQLLGSLAAASDMLTADFGTWQAPWGNINRFQRLDDSVRHPHFDDSKPSIPVPFTSSMWGSLAAFGARAYPNTKRWYGTSGNSFVCVVDFGPQVEAWAVSTGGESGNPASPHFEDQATRYATGNLRQVYFHRSELQGHIERQYHPGS
jgi:acyl-homoserine-lactone acylase